MAAPDDLYRLLRDSTGRLVWSGGSGTAFFVGPKLVLTCGHVGAPALVASESLEFHFRKRIVGAHVKEILPAGYDSAPTATTFPYPDLALVEVGVSASFLPLLPGEPTPGDDLYTYGYTDEYPDGDSALFVYEGPTSADELLYRLKESQARPGLSGAPLLDPQRGGVVAIVKRTRNKDTDLGSRAVPMTTVLGLLPRLFKPLALSSGPETAVTDRLLDIHRRNLATYKEALACPGDVANADELTKQADQARETIANLQQQLNAGPFVPSSELESSASAALPPRGEFVGRAAQLGQLKDALRERGSVVAVEGMGGVGKSALSLEVAHGWSSVGFDGVVWVSAVERAVGLVDVADTIARVLEYPAVTRLPDGEKSEELRRVMAGRRYLVVLDGFENVEDAQVDDFVRAMPEANKALLTSRRAVTDARSMTLRGLNRDEALELLHSEAARLGIGDIDAAADHLQILFEKTGGSPLALKWALGLVRQGSDLAEVIEALDSAEGAVFQVIIGRTWDALSEPARKLLMVMPCFAAPARKQRMQRAADLSDEDFDAAVESLTKLSLLEQDGSISRRAFTVPPLLRSYADSHLNSEEGLERAARMRLAADYIDLITEYRTDYAKGFDQIEAELANVLDAIEWCYVSEQWREVVDLVEGLAEFLWVRGYWSERIKRSTQALEAARRLGDSNAAGRFAYYIGWVYSRWHQQDAVRQWADQVEQLMAPSYGADNPYALELRGLAAFRRAQTVAPPDGDDTTAFKDAEALLKRALSLFQSDTQSPNAPYLVTTVTDNLGELYGDWGRDDDARSSFETVLADAETNQWDERLATANGDLADLAYKRGEDALAARLYETSLAHALRIKRANTIALCRLGLGHTLRRQGQLETAYDNLREAFEIYRRLGATSVIDGIETDLNELAAQLKPDGQEDLGVR